VIWKNINNVGNAPCSAVANYFFESASQRRACAFPTWIFILKIKKNIFDEIIAHAQRGAPIEMCGYLAGQNGVITKHYEMTNIDHSVEHFFLIPESSLMW
jgi:hypothetical protein